VVIFAVVIVCALGVVTSQHKARKLFIALQQENNRSRQMEIEWDRLQLEQSTLALPSRVEKISSQQLQMQMPQNGQIQFVRAGH
jgi:cell division protein FtsL